MATSMNWSAVEQAAVEQILTAVTALAQAQPEAHVYAAIFHDFYGDGTVTYWPSLTVATEERLAEVVARYAQEYGPGEYGVGGHHTESLRWSGPDLDAALDAGESETALANAAQAYGTRNNKSTEWDAAYGEFLQCFPRAARRASEMLARDGVVSEEFIAIAADEAGELVPLSLTAAQLARHFPEFAVQEAERQRIASLPVADQVAEVVPNAVFAVDDEGLLLDEYDDLARALDTAAVPTLIEVLLGHQPGEAWKAAMLLAEINHDAPEVVTALTHVMLDACVEVAARAWSASALARLGRTALIVAAVDQLPVEVAARGLTDPYGSFRDHGKHRPLDYAPLEAALRAHPSLVRAVASELEPGSGFCVITDAEVPAAQAGLESEFELIRVHAATVLEEHRGELTS